jgi:hypothetical protein
MSMMLDASVAQAGQPLAVQAREPADDPVHRLGGRAVPVLLREEDFPNAFLKHAA